ncbi:MAG: response regulator [Proteobacteria bacterium]|nr:response regulator [Pseudomonadota bacterium]
MNAPDILDTGGEAWGSDPEVRVLVIDDSLTIRQALSRELQKLGLTVTEACDGMAGLDIATGQRFDLIITDIALPGLDGLDLCRKLKSSTATKSTPIIIVSSHDTEEDIEKCFEAGAAAFASKLEGRQELLRHIEKVLSRSFFLRDRMVLVVDDSRLIRNIAREGLIRAGFNVLTAENGIKALEQLRLHRPDLIISDISMPEMDGYELCSALRKKPEWATIPFVVMSTAGERSVIRRMMERGACAFLEKPFNTEQLVITAEKLLSDHFQLLLKEKERLDMERSLMLGSIASLVQALEARDLYTRGHSETVAEVSIGIASIMEFPQEEIDKLYIAARLHDLGKIGIRDDILLKPDELTAQEFAAIQRHPVIGAEILSPIPSLAAIVPGVLYHHERMNGQGYPDGLKGSQIPIFARIIAVADIYHTIISDRPYRRGVARERAMTIIEEAAGDELCPESVSAFMQWLHSRQASLAE